jgi:hypothetical protein
MMKQRLLLLATALCLIVPQAFAQSKVPSMINYQGNVRNAAGVPIGAGTPVNRTVTFRFYKSPTSVLAADRLWSESQTVTILDGNFNVLIGNGTPVGGEANAVTPFANVFSQSTSVYLGITVDDGNSGTVDAEISPRQQLVSGAFAFRATVAESVDNQAITTGMLASNSVTDAQIGSSAVTSGKIAGDAVNGDKILNGTIQAVDLANGSVTTDQILDGTISSLDIAADTITAGNIKPGAVASSEILDGSIDAIDINSSAVTTEKIKDAAVTTEKIASGVNLAAGTLSATGNVTIGSSATTRTLLLNNKSVPVAEENLRIIRGTVTAAPVITSGIGFTAVANGAAVKVTFSAGTFSSEPSVVVSTLDANDGWTQNVSGISSTGFASGAALSGTGYARRAFTFIAIGPR